MSTNNDVILVTGSTGFIGRKVMEALEKKGYTAIGMGSRDCDISKLDGLTNYIDEIVKTGKNISHVIHLAGRVDVFKSWSEPERFFSVNTAGCMNVLEVCRKYNMGMTYISAYVYGQPESLPISEKAPVKPNNPYAQSKYMAEQLCKFYSTNYDIKTSIIRPFNVYGPGQSRDFVIPHIIDEVKNQDVIHVLDLVPKRDYVYIDDLVEAIISAVGKDIYGEVINIGSGVSYSVQEVVDMLQEIGGTKKEVKSKNQVRKNEMNNVVADISQAEKLLGWKPSTDIRQGLKNTYLSM